MPVTRQPNTRGRGGKKGGDSRGDKNGRKSAGPKTNSVRTPVDDSMNRLVRDRMLFISTQLLGCSVDVQVKSGVTYTGILCSVGLERGFGVALKFARTLEDSQKVLKPAPIPTLVIENSDFVMLSASKVDLGSGGLQTDTEISASVGGTERELMRWQPDADDSAVDLSLEGGSGKWDQFEANKKFGVKDTWDENLYTTPLNKKTEDYEAREKEAARIAASIEGRTTKNPHLAEERGQRLENDNSDEEAKYSSVSRQGPESSAQKKNATPPDTGKEAPAPKKTLPKLKLNPKAKEFVPKSTPFVPQQQPAYPEWNQPPPEAYGMPPATFDPAYGPPGYYPGAPYVPVPGQMYVGPQPGTARPPATYSSPPPAGGSRSNYNAPPQ